MYNDYFGLQKMPFCLTPDPEFLYLTVKHREALAGLAYAIMARRGFVVLTGDAGTGKTTLLTRVLKHLPESRVRSSVIVNPTLTPSEFLEAAMLDFGFQKMPDSKARRILLLQGFLWAEHREGRIAALIVDEAHKLTPELIEEIRLLGNFESANEKLLQVVLVGQRELDGLLNCESLRQFKQRISMRLTIDPLTAEEVANYIGCRWAKAGGSTVPFTAEAMASIAAASQGIPRVINVICDNALLTAFAEQAPSVGQPHILAVCQDLQIAVPQSSAIATAALPKSLPPAATPMVETFPMKTLERYEAVAAKPSWFARLTGRRKLIQRTEPA